jgi:acyl-CoA dehydrogenase
MISTFVAGSALAQACEVARRTAAAVDTSGAFPAETFAALERGDLLSPLDPDTGRPWSMSALVDLVTPLARACGSSGLALAMHHSILHTIVRAARSDDVLAAFVDRAAGDQPLLASATSETASGGDIRTSSAACEPAGDGRVVIRKSLAQSSYLSVADILVITARRDPEAAPGDQVVVLADRGQFRAETGAWNALGMRGTASGPATITCTVPKEQVAREPWGTIASQAMMPAAHLAWSACWLGIALEALDRARRFTRTATTRSPDLAAARRAHYADLLRTAAQLDRSVRSLAASYDDTVASGRSLARQQVFEHAQMRIAASDQATTVVLGALRLVGVSAYLEDGDLSLARALRDVLSSTVMISEDRIRSDGGLLAAMLPPFAPDPSLPGPSKESRRP